MFVGHRLAVFVDGEFWHGKKLTVDRMASMDPYWQRKIARNVARAQRVNGELAESGWTVIRVTDRTVLRQAGKVAAYVERALDRRFRGYRPPGVELDRSL